MYTLSSRCERVSGREGVPLEEVPERYTSGTTLSRTSLPDLSASSRAEALFLLSAGSRAVRVFYLSSTSNALVVTNGKMRIYIYNIYIYILWVAQAGATSGLVITRKQTHEQYETRYIIESLIYSIRQHTPAYASIRRTNNTIRAI